MLYRHNRPIVKLEGGARAQCQDMSCETNIPASHSRFFRLSLSGDDDDNTTPVKVSILTAAQKDTTYLICTGFTLPIALILPAAAASSKDGVKLISSSLTSLSITRR